MAIGTPQTVLVTGADGALGRVVCQRFLEAGSHVIGTYHHEPGSKGDKTAWLQMDVTDSHSVRAGLASVRSSGLSIDGLVHCAGGFRYAKAEQNLDADLDFLINTNLRSAFILIRELLPHMKENNYGRIVLVSSKSTLNPPAGMSAYAATKAGLNALVTSVAEELKSFNVNINAVLPTVIDTPANRRDMKGADFSTWVKPEALAEIIVSLTQDLGTPIHGALIPVAGRV